MLISCPVHGVKLSFPPIKNTVNTMAQFVSFDSVY